MNLNRFNMLLWSELFSDFHCSYVCRNQQCMCFCVLICKSRRLGECTRTRADFLPSSTGSLSADCSSRTTIQFLNISIMVFLFTSPKRSLVSSDLPPVCIRKERLYYPAHSWYLISLQALGANPTTPVLLVSPLGACICACVCVQTGTSASDNPKLVTFSALYTKGMGLWPIASDIAELPTSAPTLSSETMYCISTLNTSLLFNYHLTTGGHSPKEFGHSLKPNLATGRDEKKKNQNLAFFFAYFQQIVGTFQKVHPMHGHWVVMKIAFLN